MKRYIAITAGIISLLCLSSCKKLLTEKLHSSLTPDNFYKTVADAESGLNGVFSQLTYQTYYQRGVYLINDLSCDLFHTNNASADRDELYMGTYSANNGILHDWWENSYTMIKNANDFIVNVPGIDIDSTIRNDLLGNAHFLRALAYFELACLYGDVPLVLQSDASQDLFPKRTSEDSVYMQVIADLQYAEANCYHTADISPDKIGRVSSEAASALMARVYLQRASTSFAQSSDSQSALDECNKVIAYAASHGDRLGLESSYADVFDVNKKNGKESMFAVQFSSINSTVVNITNLMFDPGSLGGYASFLPLDMFVNSFDPDDLRKQTNVGTVDAGITYISKYRDPNVVAGAFGGTNWMIIRYADVLLMQSEAMNNVDPGNAAKFDGINAVRTRAGLSAKLLSFSNTPDATAFNNAMINERYWELSIEGHRRIDLIRFGKFQQVKALEGFTIDNNHLLMPLPQTELDVNPNLVQNPGY